MKTINYIIWGFVTVALVLAIVFTYTMERRIPTFSSSDYAFDLEDFLEPIPSEGDPIEADWFYFGEEDGEPSFFNYAFRGGFYEFSDINNTFEAGEYQATISNYEDVVYQIELTSDDGEIKIVEMRIMGDYSANIDGRVFLKE